MFLIIYIYIYQFIYYNEEKILYDNLLFDSFCLFLGYLLNIILVWITLIQSKEKEKPIRIIFKERITEPNASIYYKSYEQHLSIKKILKFYFICLIPLLIEFLEDVIYKIDTGGNDNDRLNNYDDEYIIIKYIIIFLLSKFNKEVYYKHQYISFFILILVEAIKNIYFLKNILYYNTSFIITIILNIICSALIAFFFICIKELMKYKFISPAKCNFMIEIINFPLIILIYFIISFTSFGNIKSNYYYDNIFELFKNIGKSDAKNMAILISLPFALRIFQFIINKIIYDYTIFHLYIPLLIGYFIENITKNLETFDNIFLISSFFIELIMILIFVEAIEINLCGLNKNLKRNIEFRGIIDLNLTIENDNDDDNVDGRKDETTRL